MPSRDVKADSVAQLRAKVMDIKGNPVEGETVTFEIDTGSINHEGVELIGNPYLGEPPGQNELTAVTDESGYATVSFHPGEFAEPDDGKRIAARGNATVRATWGTATRSLILTWMNYPYLSVETEVSPATIGMNDTVDVTIRLKGDGYELQPDPIDVVLVIDRSGSMSETDMEGHKTRMAAAKAAASTFIGQMNPDRDQIGLVSFSSSTTVDNELGDSFEAVTAKLNSLNANGATQLRRGIYEAIRMQNESSHDPDAIKAVVIMTDGEWNYDGSPIAHGTGYPQNSSGAYTFSGNKLEPNHYRYYDGLGGTLTRKNKNDYWRCTDGEFTNQNMSRFASDNGVRLYTITFADSPNETVRDTMNLLATSTGGFYEHAQSGAELTDVYKRIAGELKTEAGVNTTMTVFENVEVNETPIDAFEVFDYRHENGVSTYILNKSGNGTILYSDTIDQTAGWKNNHNLHFDIGTIHLNQVWEAKIRLAVNSSYEAGDYNNINIFGHGASLSFNNGEDTLDLPDTFLTVLPDLNNTGITSAWLEVDLKDPKLPADQESFTDTVPLEWTITYNGTSEIHETLAYSNDKLSWTVFWKKTVDNSTTGDTTWLDARSLTAGDYWIRLTAWADDAPDARDTTSFAIPIGSTSRAYIKIE